ncbi:MAG: nuclear transport factor 2 family protein [Terriglobia bacterium]
MKNLEEKRSEITVRQILLLPLLTIALAGFARGQGTAGNQTDAEIEKQVLNVERERDQAIQKRDMATLDRIHGDDLSFVNTHGMVVNKTQYLDDIRSGKLKFLSFKQDDYHFYIYGDTVVMTGRAISVVKYHGRVNHIPRRFTSVYIKQGGQWRLVAHQATLIKQP